MKVRRMKESRQARCARSRNGTDERRGMKGGKFMGSVGPGCREVHDDRHRHSVGRRILKLQPG